MSIEFSNYVYKSDISIDVENLQVFDRNHNNVVKEAGRLNLQILSIFPFGDFEVSIF